MLSHLPSRMPYCSEKYPHLKSYLEAFCIRSPSVEACCFAMALNLIASHTLLIDLAMRLAAESRAVSVFCRLAPDRTIQRW